MHIYEYGNGRVSIPVGGSRINHSNACTFRSDNVPSAFTNAEVLRSYDTNVCYIAWRDGKKHLVVCPAAFEVSNTTRQHVSHWLARYGIDYREVRRLYDDMIIGETVFEDFEHPVDFEITLMPTDYLATL